MIMFDTVAHSKALEIVECLVEEFGDIFTIATYPTRTQRVMDVMLDSDVVFHFTFGEDPTISGKCIPTLSMPLPNPESQLINAVMQLYHDLGLSKTEFYENHSRKFKFK